MHFNLGGKRPLIPLDLDGAEHTRFRKLLDPLFSPKSVARLSDQVRELTNALIDDFAGKGEVELFEAFCVPLPSQIFIRLLGLPMSDAPPLRRLQGRHRATRGRHRGGARRVQGPRRAKRCTPTSRTCWSSGAGNRRATT